MNYTRRHLWLGWWSLLGFLMLGLALELLHGFKAGLYLDVQNETRRLMWTLAHAHGALLGLVHIAFALSLPYLPSLDARGRARTSWCLIAASVLLPGGFFAGGLRVYGGDPGPGIILAPVGATSLLIAVFLAARASGSAEVPRTPSDRRS
jgi:hypothetical protein